MIIQEVLENLSHVSPFAFPPEDALAWFAAAGKVLEPLPANTKVFNDLDGQTINFEWTFFHRHPSLEINVVTREAYYSLIDFNKTINDDVQTSKELDLNQELSWEWLAAEIDAQANHHIHCIRNSLIAYSKKEYPCCEPMIQGPMNWLIENATQLLTGIKTYTYPRRGLGMDGTTMCLEWHMGIYDGFLKIDFAEFTGEFSWINWDNPRHDHGKKAIELKNPTHWKEMVDTINEKLTLPVLYNRILGEDDDVMDVEEYRASVRAGFFTDYDGHARPVRDNKHAACTLAPSQLELIPVDATHIAWYNK